MGMIYFRCYRDGRLWECVNTEFVWEFKQAIISVAVSRAAYIKYRQGFLVQAVCCLTGTSMTLCKDALRHCAVSEKFHTHPMEGHWKFLGRGGS